MAGNADTARAALATRRLDSSVLGVLMGAAVASVLGRAAVWWLGFEVHIGWIIGAAVLLFALLEVGVRRDARGRRAPATRLVEALVGEVDDPVVDWRAGLPTLRTADYQVRFEANGGALRVGVALGRPPGVYLWTARRGDERVDAWAQRMEARGAEPVPGAPASIWALSADAELAKGFVEAQVERLLRLCDHAQAVVELGDDARWTAALDGMDAGTVQTAAGDLAALRRDDDE